MTHALAAFISFGKVKGFKVSKKGGAVKTDKSNVFISLAPYFFPTYTLIVMLAWFVIGKFWQIGDWIYVFSFGVGFTLAFHFVMTVEFLKTKQPDMIKSGYLFSIALIYLINITIAAAILSFMFSDFSFKGYFENTYVCGKEAYEWLFRQFFSLRNS